MGCRSCWHQGQEQDYKNDGSSAKHHVLRSQRVWGRPRKGKSLKICRRIEMKSLRYLSAILVVLLVATVLAQAQSAPTYRNIPLWPRPFADDSWVLGSVTGV